jgi:hypothetical protein
MKRDDEDIERWADPDAGPERVAILDAAREEGFPAVEIGSIRIAGEQAWADAVSGSSDVVRIALQGALRLHAAGGDHDTDDDAADARAFIHESEPVGGIGVGGSADVDVEDDQ